MACIGVGKIPTRPLLAPTTTELRESLLCGGNTVFLDLDALFWPPSNPGWCAAFDEPSQTQGTAHV
jgi:hypothetical protein